jgi:hypothetical protein
MEDSNPSFLPMTGYQSSVRKGVSVDPTDILEPSGCGRTAVT